MLNLLYQQAFKHLLRATLSAKYFGGHKVDRIQLRFQQEGGGKGGYKPHGSKDPRGFICPYVHSTRKGFDVP